MTLLAVLRHAPTEWNGEKRLQGRADIGLSDEGRAALSGLRPPPAVRGFACVTSPLSRCRETAGLLGLASCATEPALTEMDWGAWEGRRLPELRAALGEEMAAMEAMGLDLCPPGGESPRQVRERLKPWLAGLNRDTLAVTHKGVIRALLSLATGWDMTSKPPVRLDWRAVHLFTIEADGHPRPHRLNLPLERP